MNIQDLLNNCLRALRDGIKDRCIERWTACYGEDWLAQICKKLRIPEKENTVDDPAFLLKGLEKTWWKCWKDIYKKPVQALVLELIDIRNRSAHFEDISVEDAIRALDTIARLLKAFGAKTQQEIVEKILRELRQQQLFADGAELTTQAKEAKEKTEREKAEAEEQIRQAQQAREKAEQEKAEAEEQARQAQQEENIRKEREEAERKAQEEQERKEKEEDERKEQERIAKEKAEAEEKARKEERKQREQRKAEEQAEQERARVEEPAKQTQETSAAPGQSDPGKRKGTQTDTNGEDKSHIVTAKFNYYSKNRNYFKITLWDRGRELNLNNRKEFENRRRFLQLDLILRPGNEILLEVDNIPNPKIIKPHIPPEQMDAYLKWRGEEGLPPEETGP